MSDVTRILSQIEAGDPQAADQLLPLVYDELRTLAAARLKQEKPGQTLQATALVHEAYVRLVGQGSGVGDQESGGAETAGDGSAPLSDSRHPTPDSPRFDSRSHFFAAAAEAMRRILVDRARRRQSLKRGGGLEQQPLEDLEIAGPVPDEKLLAVSAALEDLAASDRTAAELVKLRFFAGLTGKEAAACLGLAERSADRVWVYARSWLLKYLSE